MLDPYRFPYEYRWVTEDGEVKTERGSVEELPVEGSEVVFGDPPRRGKVTRVKPRVRRVHGPKDCVKVWEIDVEPVFGPIGKR